MRRALIIGAAVLGLAGVVFAYLLFHLSAVVEANRAYILARASAELGRPVEVATIKVHLGWGIALDLREVQVADDPTFAQLPFLRARDVYAEVSLPQLLTRSLTITRIRVKQPVIRIVRNRAGQFNLSTLHSTRATAPAGAPAPAPPVANHVAGGSAGTQLQLAGPSGRGTAAGALRISSLLIEDGTLTYVDEQAGGAPLNFQHFGLTITDFSLDAPFHLEATLAAFTAKPNLAVAGVVGQLRYGGVIVAARAPLALTATVGPVALAQLRTLPPLAGLLPPALTVSAPATITATLSGPLDALHLAAQGDLTANRIVYGTVVDKAAGIPLQLDVQALRTAARLDVSRVAMVLAGSHLTATDLAFGGGNLAAHLAGDHIDLAGVAKVMPWARDYQLGGAATLAVRVALTGGQPTATGSLVFEQVSATPPGGQLPPLTALNGQLLMAGDTAKVGPLTAQVGASHATFAAAISSFAPLRTTYQASLDTLKPGDFSPARRPLGEAMTQLVASGTLSRDGGKLAATTQLASAAGMLARVAYQKLTLSASWDGSALLIDTLSGGAFDGTLGVAGTIHLAATPDFDLKLSVRNIDLQQALESQQAKAAATIRGRLTGDLQIYGVGKSFDQLRPTLRGAGRATLAQGKLLGVNVVAQALSKINNLPGIGALVPAAVISRHPELFQSHDTAIDQASLTFTVQGPRLTSHDIDARTADYTILGDGWFDMDQRLDLAARILLSPAFSGELVGARRNVAYLENPARQIEIPLRITGRLPKPQVLPDVAILIQRATTNAVEGQLGKFLGGAAGKGSSAPSKNPLDQLKNLFR